MVKKRKKEALLKGLTFSNSASSTLEISIVAAMNSCQWILPVRSKSESSNRGGCEAQGYMPQLNFVAYGHLPMLLKLAASSLSRSILDRLKAFSNS